MLKYPVSPNSSVRAPGWNLLSLGRRVPLLALPLHPLGFPTDEFIWEEFEILAPESHSLSLREVDSYSRVIDTRKVDCWN